MLAPDADLDQFASLFGAISRRAGEVILKYYRDGFDLSYKDDGSPLTTADRESGELIIDMLHEAVPHIPVVSEEDGWRELVAGDVARQFILVDPLDGTREFVARNDEFTVNIALVRAGVPVAGAVYAPVFGDLYIGGRAATLIRTADRGGKARNISTRSYTSGNLTVAVSRSHLDPQTSDFIAALPAARQIMLGSSLKFCALASGKADIYPRCGTTMEWDTAAGHAILVAAGGQVLCPDGGPFLYGKIDQEFRNGPFIAWGREPLKHVLDAGST